MDLRHATIKELEGMTYHFIASLTRAQQTTLTRRLAELIDTPHRTLARNVHRLILEARNNTSGYGF